MAWFRPMGADAVSYHPRFAGDPVQGAQADKQLVFADLSNASLPVLTRLPIGVGR